MEKRFGTAIWLLPIIALGTALRLYHLTAIAIWHDEAFSALFMHYSWPEMLRRIAADVHPPLYYVVLRGWYAMFGWSVVSLRAFSVLFGVLTIPMGYLFVRAALASDRTALFAALCLAVNPFQITYSQEARMYALGMFLVMLSSYLLITALASNSTGRWVGYGVAIAACCYTHYFLLFSVAAQGAYFLYHVYRAKRWNWKGVGAFVLGKLLYLPWIPTFLAQVKRVDGNFWIYPPDAWSVPGTIWAMAFGGQGVDHFTALLATIVALFVLKAFVTGTEDKARWLAGLGLVVPFVCALLLSIRQAIYQDRYFLFASLFFSIIIAQRIMLLSKPATRRVWIWLFPLMSVGLLAKNWHDIGLPKPGMAGASDFLNRKARAQDRIYVASTFIYFSFKYYNTTSIAPKLISSGPLSTIPHYSGTALLDPSDLVLTDTIFHHADVAAGNIVWVLWTDGYSDSRPSVPDAWRVLAEEQWGDAPAYRGNIYITQYRVD